MPTGQPLRYPYQYRYLTNNLTRASPSSSPPSVCAWSKQSLHGRVSLCKHLHHRHPTRRILHRNHSVHLVHLPRWTQRLHNINPHHLGQIVASSLLSTTAHSTWHSSFLCSAPRFLCSLSSPLLASVCSLLLCFYSFLYFFREGTDLTLTFYYPQILPRESLPFLSNVFT